MLIFTVPKPYQDHRKLSSEKFCHNYPLALKTSTRDNLEVVLIRFSHLVVIVFTLFLATTCFADGDCRHNKSSFQCVEYVKNYDADTLTVNIPGLHPLVGKNMKIRVRGVDTPEVRTKNKCEKSKGRHAKKLVKNLLKKAKRIDLTNIERGKYFRIVADVIIDGNNLTHYLVKNGLGYPYEGGTKKTINWCKDLKVLAKEFQVIDSKINRKAASE